MEMEQEAFIREQTRLKMLQEEQQRQQQLLEQQQQLLEQQQQQQQRQHPEALVVEQVDSVCLLLEYVTVAGLPTLPTPYPRTHSHTYPCTTHCPCANHF